jgi:hypothetical protein
MLLRDKNPALFPKTGLTENLPLHRIRLDIQIASVSDLNELRH